MKHFDPSTKFIKSFKKAPKEVVLAFKKRIGIFEENEFDQILNNHKLHGKYADCRSINITGNWRLVYINKGNDSYLLADIGTHPQLFG